MTGSWWFSKTESIFLQALEYEQVSRTVFDKLILQLNIMTIFKEIIFIII